MSSVKIVLLSSEKKKRKDGTHPLVVSVTVNRKTNVIRTGYFIKPEFWNGNGSELATRPKHPNYNALQSRLDELKIKAFDLMIELDSSVPNWDFKVFKQSFLKKGNEEATFFDYIDQYSELCEKNGQVSKVRTLHDLKTNLIRYHDRPVYFSDITIVWLKNLQIYYRSKGMVGRNYLKEIRTLYNRAIIENVAKKEDYPFGQWGFRLPGIVKKQRGLSFQNLKLIVNYKTDSAAKNRAAKLWLLVFYCIGMDWKVLCTLRVKNYEDGRFDYIRGKTGKPFSIKINAEAKKIIDEFRTGKKPDDYLFGIIPDFTKKEKDRIHFYADSRRSTINNTLSKIKRELGIKSSLTVRTARYTWASIARNELNVTTELIQDGLGHSDIKVTQGYTNTRENKAVDDLNSRMVDLLNIGS